METPESDSEISVLKCFLSKEGLKFVERHLQRRPEISLIFNYQRQGKLCVLQLIDAWSLYDL